MSVLITFKNQPARAFPEAHWAFLRDGIMIVQQKCVEDRSFDGATVVSACVTLDSGEETVVPGLADFGPDRSALPIRS